MRISIQLFVLSAVLALIPIAKAQYTYDVTDAFPAGFPNHSLWTSINGNTLSDIPGTGITNANGSDAIGGSLISSYIPSTYRSVDSSSDYEVKETLTITDGSGANFIIYLRAAPGALHTGGSTASYYALVLANVTGSSGNYTGQLVLYLNNAGTITILHSIYVPLKNGSTFRGVIKGNLLIAYVDDVVWILQSDSALSTGSPGIGLVRTPAGNGILNASIGHLDRVVPATIPLSAMQTSPFSNRIDFHWTPPADVGNSLPTEPAVGIAYYDIYRYSGGVPLWLNYTASPQFTDATVSSATTYQYLVQAHDFHYNTSSTTVNVISAPASSIDPRQVGVRSTGSYWGGGGEQIDMRSGNLNFTVPLLKAQARGGWGLGWSLNYNSQNWRQDSSATLESGRRCGLWIWMEAAGGFTDTSVLEHYGGASLCIYGFDRRGVPAGSESGERRCVDYQLGQPVYLV